MEQLITLLVVGAFWLLPTLIEKLRERRASREANDPGRAPPTRREASAQEDPGPESWEEELRRLLEGSPAPRPPEPSVPAHVPPPLPAPPLAQPIPARRIAPSVAEEMDPLEASTRAYFKASQVENATTALLSAATAKSDRPATRAFLTSSLRPAASPVGISARQLLKNRQSLREAMVASVILGPPRALMPEN